MKQEVFTNYQGLKHLVDTGETPTLIFIPEMQCWVIGVIDHDRDVRLFVCTNPREEPDKFETVEEALEQIENVCETPVVVTPKQKVS